MSLFQEVIDVPAGHGQFLNFVNLDIVLLDEVRHINV